MMEKHTKKKSNSNDNKKGKANINDSITKIQFSDLDISIEIEDNGSLGWRSLPKIPSTSEDSDSCDTNETE